MVNNKNSKNDSINAALVEVLKQAEVIAKDNGFLLDECCQYYLFEKNSSGVVTMNNMDSKEKIKWSLGAIHWLIKDEIFVLLAQENSPYRDTTLVSALAHSNFLLGVAFALSKTPNREEMLSNFGRQNAIRRHIETYEIKEQAIQYWTNNIDPKLSNDKAADLLTKVVPLSHRKLSQYVSEAKKQIIPFGSKV